MKKASIALLFTFFALNAQASAQTSAQASEQSQVQCFIAKESGKIVKQIGKCNSRHSPYSTFKIAIAVMGFDSGILKNPQRPLLEVPKGIFPSELYDFKKYPTQTFSQRAQTPQSWMKYSVIWYSQEITKKLGEEKFEEYVKKLNYGNEDVSGTPGKNDGLLHSWLGNSLKISPLEQVDFLEKLSERKLPLSKQAQENTIKIIALENIWDDWKLYGKTGGGMEEGWFVGFIEKNNRRIAFAQYVTPKNPLISAGRIAKEVAKDNLISLTLSQNK